MRRREFIALTGGIAACPFSTRAQPSKIVRVAVLWAGASAPESPRIESFSQGLRGSGYTQGSNLSIEVHHSDKGAAALRDLAVEAVSRDARVIATFGDLATRAAQEATKTVPIVATADDILGAKLVSSLSRPAGNTTGLTLLSTDMVVKRLEVIKQLLPGLSRVVALWDASAGPLQVKSAEQTAQSLNVKLHIVEVRSQDDLSGALQTAISSHPEALFLFSSPFLASLYRPIVEFAAAHRLPAIYQWKEHVSAGGLVSYGQNLAAVWRHAGVIVAKILNGAKPAELPIEQPTKFELVINLKTAKALGLTVPPSIMVRADEIIE
jgi:putative tryptophan/tyrosine transport system substrate-binding protein